MLGIYKRTFFLNFNLTVEWKPSAWLCRRLGYTVVASLLIPWIAADAITVFRVAGKTEWKTTQQKQGD